MVEIGSWKGRSTIAIALALKTRGAGTVFAIDPHTGAPGHTAVGPVITAEEFKHNITQANVESVVTLLVTTSHAARSQFGARSVDLLFIDGSHEYDDVVTDISDWESALKDESLVAFNDPSAPGVYRALRELVLRPGGAYRRPALIQNTLFFDFRRADPWTPQDARSLRRLRAVLELRFRAVPFWRFMPRWFVRMGHAVSRRLVSRRPYA
ncbi:MAG TPA: class I SAM-dependent methyltransferase [Edaphobacter sp.]